MPEVSNLGKSSRGKFDLQDRYAARGVRLPFSSACSSSVRLGVIVLAISGSVFDHNKLTAAVMIAGNVRARRASYRTSCRSETRQPRLR